MLNNKNKNLKALVIVLELLVMGLIIYLIDLPIWPVLEYKYFYQNKTSAADSQDIKKVESQTEQIINHLPAAKENISANRLIITKIGVNAPIIEAKNSADGLSLGAWRMPESSTPDKGGNTVISGHRFKYLPPNNLTFFLFDKLAKDDIISVSWRGKNYFYKIKEIKIIEPTDLSILKPTANPTLTLYTCDPIYSQKNRLVVIAELTKDKPIVEQPVLPKAIPQLLGVKYYPNGSLIRGQDKKIYLIQNNKLVVIRTLAQLRKYADQKIYDVSDPVIRQYMNFFDGQQIRGPMKKIYVIINGKKQPILTLIELSKYRGQEIYDVSDEILALY